MKILAVSDRVLDKLYSGTIRQTYSDVDLMIGCGAVSYTHLDVYKRQGRLDGQQLCGEGDNVSHADGDR